VNEEIRAAKVRVIGEDGQQIGVLTPHQALNIARNRGKDLIEIVPNASPPVCKIMEFGKYKYELTKKERLQRKHQHISQLKEIRFHPNTDVHDFEFKARHAMRFLEEGHKVKASVIFKGREITYVEQGEDVLHRLTEKLNDFGKIDQPMKLEGRSMSMIFVPNKSGKKKSEPKSSS
jgi:translation initiation factor IF-3